MSSIEDAITSLKEGNFILLHDDSSREDEVDMVIAAEHVKPYHIAKMRRDAGGLICVAIGFDIAKRLELKYMHEILAIYFNSKNKKEDTRNIFTNTPYGDMPSFSISVNHRSNYTGITDTDRSKTIKEIANICNDESISGSQKFFEFFFSPGHVPILIASRNLLIERKGHTELGICLMQMSRLTPAVTICEMLDSDSYKSLSIERAKEYAKDNNIPILEASQIEKEFNRE